MVASVVSLNTEAGEEKIESLAVDAMEEEREGREKEEEGEEK